MGVIKDLLLNPLSQDEVAGIDDIYLFAESMIDANPVLLYRALQTTQIIERLKGEGGSSLEDIYDCIINAYENSSDLNEQYVMLVLLKDQVEYLLC